VESDLLMLAASFNRSPSAPDDFCLIHIPDFPSVYALYLLLEECATQFGF
jgi:hypothetical protein